MFLLFQLPLSCSRSGRPWAIPQRAMPLAVTVFVAFALPRTLFLGCSPRCLGAFALLCRSAGRPPRVPPMVPCRIGPGPCCAVWALFRPAPERPRVGAPWSRPILGSPPLCGFCFLLLREAPGSHTGADLKAYAPNGQPWFSFVARAFSVASRGSRVPPHPLGSNCHSARSVALRFEAAFRPLGLWGCCCAVALTRLPGGPWSGETILT